MEILRIAVEAVKFNSIKVIYLANFKVVWKAPEERMCKEKKKLIIKKKVTYHCGIAARESNMTLSKSY